MRYESINNKKLSKRNHGFTDRRVFARIRIRLPLKYTKANIRTKIRKQAQTLDISAKGIGFISNENLLPNTVLEMWLELPENHQPLYLTGKVIWSKNLKGGGKEWRCGVLFDKVDLVGLGHILTTPAE